MRELSWPAAFLALGLVIGHYPMLFSRFRLMEAELGDTRFINYILEHSWLWLTHAPNHRSLWDPPFFFPASNVLAYSETMLGTAALYHTWRLIGFDMSSAYQGWLLSLSVLNFVAMYWLARRGLRASPAAAGGSSALFAFAGVRLAQAGHYQLYPQFWLLLSLVSIAIALSASASIYRQLGSFLIAPLVAMQVWASFYLGWFSVLSLCIAACVALFFRASRRPLVEMTRARFGPVVAGLAIAAILLWPMLSRYTSAAQSIGMRSFDEVRAMIPEFRNWIHLGAPSFVYGKLAELPLFLNIPMEHEQRLGYGLVTSILAVMGWWFGRKRSEIAISAICGLVLLLIASRIEDKTAWRFIFSVVPGAGAIRAVSRIGLMVLIPVSFGVAITIDRLMQVVKTRTGKLLVPGLVGLACLLEQAQRLRAFDKDENRAVVQRLASQIGRNRCHSFFYTPIHPLRQHWKYQLDAMWAEIAAGVPTINGYSGHSPPHWQLEYSVINSPEDELRLSMLLRDWANTQRVDPSRVCWLRLSLPEQLLVYN